VTDVLPNDESATAKDLGVFNIVNPLPQSIAPGIAPFLAIGSRRTARRCSSSRLAHHQSVAYPRPREQAQQ